MQRPLTLHTVSYRHIHIVLLMCCEWYGVSYHSTHFCQSCNCPGNKHVYAVHTDAHDLSNCLHTLCDQCTCQMRRRCVMVPHWLLCVGRPRTVSWAYCLVLTHCTARCGTWSSRPRGYLQHLAAIFHSLEKLEVCLRCRFGVTSVLGAFEFFHLLLHSFMFDRFV